MSNLMQSDVCSEGFSSGYMTDRTTQFTTQCPGGSYCGNETTTLNQYFRECEEGHYCKRGTTKKLKTRCGKSHFCTSGTPHPEPFTTRCPRQTTSLPGAKDIDFCIPALVAICDKMPFSETNPFDQQSYYPVEHTTSEKDESDELLVVKKIFPFNEDRSDVVPLANDTIEAFRTCPAYGVLSDKNLTKSEEDTLTVVARNLRNSTYLTCRFRMCHSSRWISETGIELISPEMCQDDTLNLGKPITKRGTYISKTRVSCPLPTADSEFRPLNKSGTPDSSMPICLRDDKGQLFLSQECSNSDLARGHCAFEGNMHSLGLRKRVYSLVLPCLEEEVVNGRCDDVPTRSTKLNPCLTQRMIVDVSNNGKKFSGEETIIPYTSLDSSDSPHGVDKSHQIHPTYGIYKFIPESILEMLEVDGSSAIEKQHVRSNFDTRIVLCANVLQSTKKVGVLQRMGGSFHHT